MTTLDVPVRWVEYVPDTRTLNVWLHGGTLDGDTLTLTRGAAPEAPQGLTVAPYRSGRFWYRGWLEASWRAVQGVSGYALSWQVGEGEWSGPLRVDGTYVVLPVPSRAPMRVRVRARGIDDGPWSEPVSVTSRALTGVQGVTWGRLASPMTPFDFPPSRRWGALQTPTTQRRDWVPAQVPRPRHWGLLGRR